MMERLHTGVIVGMCCALATAGAALTGPGAPEDVLAGSLDGEVACALFAPGTPDDYVQEVTAALRGSARHQASNQSWFGLGSTGDLTYSFPADGFFVPGGQGIPDAPGANVLHQRLNTAFAPGGENAWKQVFQSVFGRWSEITGIHYQEIADDDGAFGAGGSFGRGDVRIVMKTIDGPGGILAYNMFPPNGDMVLDQAENWGNPVNLFRFAKNIISHEHGHGIGLNHNCPANGTKLMEPFLNTNFDGPQHDDVRGGQWLYNDRFGPAFVLGGSPTIPNIGNVNVGEQVVVEEVAIRAPSDADRFGFNVQASALVTVTLEPVGLTYPEGPQGPGCPMSSTINSLAIADLRLDLLEPNAQMILATADQTERGEAESIVEFELGNNSAETFFVGVTGHDFTDDTQLYRVTIAVNASVATCPSDLNGDGETDATDLAVLLGGWAVDSAIADVNGDGVNNGADLAFLLGAWGVCPE